MLPRLRLRPRPRAAGTICGQRATTPDPLARRLAKRNNSGATFAQAVADGLVE